MTDTVDQGVYYTLLRDTELHKHVHKVRAFNTPNSYQISCNLRNNC